jgi:hypothetical protein
MAPRKKKTPADEPAPAPKKKTTRRKKKDAGATEDVSLNALSRMRGRR